MDFKLYYIILYITKVNKYFIGILNSWIVMLPTKYTKLNVQQIKMILQYEAGTNLTAAQETDDSGTNVSRL